MKLYIAKPSDNWAYCGGGLVAIANDLEDLRELLKSTEYTDDMSIFNSEDEIGSGEFDGLRKWVIVEVLEVGEIERRIVLFNYHWA